jgi:hypothetical protein
MTRPYGKLKEFVDDLYALRSAGYTHKADYAQRLGLTESCFSQRISRARRQGLLLPGQCRSRVFDLFGDHL